MARVYKDRHNDKRRIIYFLEHHHMGWVADIVKREKPVKKTVKKVSKK